MSNRLPWVGPGRAIVAVAVNAFLALSLISYHPTDPPGIAQVPAPEHPLNLCGPVGATLAHALMSLCGFGAIVIVYAVAVAALLVVRRRRLDEPAGPAIGLVLMILVVAALSQKYDPDLGAGPPVGSGGYVGSALLALLEGQLGPAGFVLSLATLGLVGLGAFPRLPDPHSRPRVGEFRPVDFPGQCRGGD